MGKICTSASGGPTERTTWFPLKFTSRVQLLPAAFIASVTSPTLTPPCHITLQQQTQVWRIYCRLDRQLCRLHTSALPHKAEVPEEKCSTYEADALHIFSQMHSISLAIKMSEVGRKHHSDSRSHSGRVYQGGNAYTHSENWCRVHATSLLFIQASRRAFSHCLISLLKAAPDTQSKSKKISCFRR